VGLLSLQAEVYKGAEPYPLDVLDAGTQGMIGYLIQQELRNLLAPGQQVATLLTMITVDPAEPAFTRPTKFVGPVYAKQDADKLAAAKGWAFRQDWGTPRQRRLARVTPEELAGYEFAAGSMGPKVEAAARFAAKTGRRAAIGSLADIAGIVAGRPARMWTLRRRLRPGRPSRPAQRRRRALARHCLLPPDRKLADGPYGGAATTAVPVSRTRPAALVADARDLRPGPRAPGRSTNGPKPLGSRAMH
jgi:hypothetical protein